MYSSKLQVDKHVSNILSHVRDEKERNSRGFQIAKLYYEVKEYETARRYLSGYLSVKETYPQAHTLLGQILEQQHQQQKALTAYKRSLELDDKQKDVLLKVCQLHCEVDVDPERARYWVERAEKVFPHHDVLFALREKMFSRGDSASDGNKQDLEELITAELVKRPQDAKLRVKLLTLFLETGRVNEAYTHAVEVEQKDPYPRSLDWYQCLLHVLETYQEESGQQANGTYHQWLLWILHKLVSLSMSQQRIPEIVDVLHRLDQVVLSSERLGSLSSEHWVVLVQEMRSQLFFHAGTVLLKKAQLERVKWKEVVALAAACYLVSYSVAPPNLHASWFVQAGADDKKTYTRWHREACFRASQAGHMIRNMAGSAGRQWMGRIEEDICNQQGKEQLWQHLFSSQMKQDKQSSFLLNNTVFTTFSPQLPEETQLRVYDEAVHDLWPDSLQHLTWTALQYYSVKDKTQPNYHLKAIEGLQRGVLNLETATPETLSQQDMEAFLYAVVRSSALSQEEQRRQVLAAPGQLHVLPVSLSERLCSGEQAEWWNAAYTLCTNSSRENLGRLRLTLQRGLETIRLVANHGLDTSLVVHLAHTFAERMEETRAESHSIVQCLDDLNVLQARAVHYWKSALQQLQKRKRNQSMRSPKYRLFESRERDLSEEDAITYEQQGSYFIAKVAMDDEHLEEAITGFDKVHIPEASFHTAQIYKRQVIQHLGNRSVADLDPEDKNLTEALLTKSHDALLITLDRIRGDRFHPLNAEVAEELEEIETRLAGLDNSNSVVEGQNLSIASDIPSPVKQTPRRNLREFAGEAFFAQSTPQGKTPISYSMDMSASRTNQSPTRLRPSPERLDAQLRSLAFSQDTIVKVLIEELRESRKSLQKLQEKVSDLEFAKKEEYTQVKEMHKFTRDLERQNLELAADKKDLLRQIQALEKENKELGKNHEEMEAERKGLRRQVRELEEEVQAQRMIVREKVMGSMTPQQHPQPAHFPPHLYYDPHRSPRPPGPPMQPHHAAYLGAAYRQPQESDFISAAQGVPSYGYPGFPPPPDSASMALHDYSYPAMQQATSQQRGGGKFQSARKHFDQDRNQEDLDDYYYEDDEEDDEETDGVGNGATENEASGNYKPDEQLPGEYPYGNDVHVEGKSKSTLGYSPQRQGVSGPTAYYAAPTEAQMAAAAMYSPPGQPIPGMPGPGYFSSPEHTSSVSTARYPMQAGMMVQGANLSQVAPGQSPARFPVFATPSSMVSQPMPQDSSVSTTQPLSKPQQASPEVNSGASPTQGPGSASSATKFPMAMPNKMGFGNLASVQSPKASPAKHGAAEDGDSEGEAEVENTSIEFRPLVSLPVVEVVTGEEQETPLFSERAKLFRFVEKQWKERGLGVMKILHNKETNNVRLLMRRDQVHKVCANHKVKPDMTIAYKAPGDDKVLTWRAFDFTDGEPRLEQFSCKFKTADIAAAFKSSFEEAINIVKAAVPETVLASPATQPMKTAQGQAEAPATEPNTVVSSARPEAVSSSAQKSPIVTTTAAGGFSFKPATTAAFGQNSASSMLQSIAAQVGKKNDVSSEAAATEKKPTFGGFTFASKPVFSFTPNDQSGTPKADVSSTTTVPQEQVTAKPNPFASFTFSPPKTAANVSPFANTPVSEADKPNGQSRLFGTVTSSSPASFASLSSKATPTVSSKDSSGKAVVPSPEAASPGRAADESGVEEYEPDVDFKPIVTLPEAVDIKTGEEEEEKVFGQKAKLFRMDPESKQWKERGVGELKIMRHKSTNRYRIVMRRDQVLKLCANHHLSKDMKLLPMVSSDKAWCWYAQDFAEEEIKSEQLAAKFKTPDLATMFKEAFEESVQKLSEVEDETPDVTPEDFTTGPQAEPNAGEGGSLASLFKKKTGDWECNICYVKNNGGAVKCVACETPKPGAETPQSSEVSSTTFVAAGFGSSAFGTKAGFSMNAPSQGFTNVSFGNVSSTTTSTSVSKLTSDGKVTESSTVSSTSGVKGFSMASQPGPGFGSFSFGSTPTTKEQSEVKEVKKTTVSEQTGGFQLRQSSPAPFTFTPTSATKGQPDSTESGQDSGFKFGGVANFSFSLTPLKDQGKTPIKSPKSPQSPLSPEYYVNKDGDDDHIYFEPVVRLPDQVETKTGEEEEEILFMHRAKLFRFFEGEWKERGLGDVKILRQSDSRKCRILMRREQVHKICLNHNIAETITLKPMPKAEGKAWVWHAQDFADGEAKHEQLAIKFKTGDIASEFQMAFNKAKTGEGEAITVSPSKVTSSPQKGDAKAKASDASNKDVFNSFSFASPQKDSADTPNSRSPFTPFGSQGGANRGSVFGGSSQLGEQPSGGSSLLQSLLAEPVKKTSDQGPLDLSSDIQIVKIEEPSADDVKKAEAFQLPRTFYLFNERPDCKGCLGCLSDEFDFSTIGGKAKVEVPRVKAPETTKVPAVESAASDKPPVEKPDSTTEEESLSMFGTAASSFGDFASIAATSSGGFGFGKSKDESQFQWQGAGASVFRGSPSKAPGDDGDDGREDDDDVEAPPDVTFEPVVQLPEVVDLKTGEEDEEIIFSQRAKLYRFDGGQWKERGVGEMKILKNRSNGRFRLLLRREQIFKVACNHYLKVDMKLKPLATSETAWIWVANDYAESEAQMQQFAVKFKTKDLSLQFKEVFEHCQEELKKLGSSMDKAGETIQPSEKTQSATAIAQEETDTTKTLAAAQDSKEEVDPYKDSGAPGISQAPGVVTASEKLDQKEEEEEGEEEEDEDEDGEYEDVDEEEEEEEEEAAPVFAKRATLYAAGADDEFQEVGMGELQVLFDEDVMGSRIRMATDKDIMVCNHVICTGYQLHLDQNKRQGEWKALDFSTDEGVRRVFRVQFSSVKALEEFDHVFQDGAELAKQSEIHEVRDTPYSTMPEEPAISNGASNSVS